MRLDRFFQCFFCFACGLSVLWLSANTPFPFFVPYKQQTIRWSTPQTIPGFNPDSRPPILLADQNHTVHAFSSQWINTDSAGVKAVMYNKWTLDNGWAEPIDILLSPINEARVTDAYLDKDGIIHVLFFGGNGQLADIYYSKAPAINADNVRSWSSPIIIGEMAADPENAVLVKDGYGNLVVTYYGRKDGNGIYTVISSDGGNNWTEPAPFFLAADEKPNISAITVTVSKSGWLHAIWAVYSISGQGRGIYYAHSQNSENWSNPTILADAQDGLGTQTPTIIEYQNTLIAIYNMPPKITMRQSLDDGLTWSDPMSMFSRHVGVNGSLSLVIDGEENLHLFFGQRITGNPDIHGMWHSVLINNRWSEPQAIVKGPRVIDKVGDNGFDPYDAQAVVSQGNVFLVTWRTDPGDIKPNGVWYAFTTLDIAELTAVPLPIYPTIDASSPTKWVATPFALTSTTIQQQLGLKTAPSAPGNPASLIIIGLIPTTALILAILSFKILRSFRR
jgi:hypothetical protein